MASDVPTRVLCNNNGKFSVVKPRSSSANGFEFDIISYRWGQEVVPYNCGIDGVDWDVTISMEKLEDIKRLMVAAGVQHLWVDCVCINQTNTKEKAAEISKMYKYYQNAKKCHILLEMTQVWNPQDIVDDLKFLDHILKHMRGEALASEAIGLSANVKARLSTWADKDGEQWTFPVDKSIARSAAIDMGVLNCYSTCISYVRSLFDNQYFTRMWTFQEMILGKNITMWGINSQNISWIGEFNTWMNLATDCKDKAAKLQEWIELCRVHKPAAVNAILRIIEEDNLILNSLQMQVKGIHCARTDIINGGSTWWHDNYKGISNIFSAVSLTPRKCKEKADIFRGLLGIFSGLFTPEEIDKQMSGDDIEKISFNFFKQLSTKTMFAWTKLAISSKERGEWDWIPVVEDSNEVMTTDCFAGVVKLGRLKQKGQANGQAEAKAMTGINGPPRSYMKIQLKRGNRGFQFILKGCNCGKKISTGVFSRELIPTNDQPKNVVKDETGKILVQCATILGAIMDPGCDVTQYRRRLLRKLQPNWRVTDPSAKPTGWINRCVSGTVWENPNPLLLKTHNMSVNYQMKDITSCESRLANESTERISCEVHVNCGCVIVAPFSLIFEAITVMEGSFLGDTYATLDKDNRIVLKDGVGLVQVGDIGSTFNLVAFGGHINAHQSYASSCRSTRFDRPAIPKSLWPSGRALIRDELKHGITEMMKDYGYVETGGNGNLLVCRKHPLAKYKIIGVCIDEYIANKKGRKDVTLR